MIIHVSLSVVLIIICWFNINGKINDGFFPSHILWPHFADLVSVYQWMLIKCRVADQAEVEHLILPALAVLKHVHA